MKIASTDTLETEPQQGKEKAHEQSRNFFLAVAQGTFIRISFAFADTTTVLSAFIYKLTASNTLVGLTGSISSAGWMWPQLFISNLLDHRPRKMPFYALGMSIRTLAWVAICLSTLLIGPRNNGLLAVSFLCFYFVGASSMGVSTLPYMDIISKAIGPQRRARFFSLRNITGGICSFFIGFFVLYVLDNEFGLAFPHNYALLFGCGAVSVGIACTIFLKIREPIHPVQTERQTLRQHLKQGPHFLRTDRNYRLFLFFRMCSQTAGMCGPFYVPYALDKLGIPEWTIGLFIAVGALSGVISNFLWMYVGEKFGVRWIVISTSAMACGAPLVVTFVRYTPTVWQMPFYLLIFALNGAAMSGMMVGFMTYMINIAPPRIRPTYIGFMNTILFPFGFMPVIAGKLIEGLTIRMRFFTIPLMVSIPAIGYEGIFAIAVGMGFFGCLIATRLEDVYHEEETSQ